MEINDDKPKNIEISEVVLLSVQSDDGYFEAIFKIHGGRPFVEVYHDLEGRRFAVGIQPRFSSFQSFQTCLYRRYKTKFGKKH